MNSYSSVSLVSHSIYKVLQYMNLISNDTNDAIEPNAVDAVDELKCESNRTPL